MSDPTAADLLRMPRRELAELVALGRPVDPDAIADREFRGVSLGLPAFVERLTWKTFKKVFYRDGHELRGWNVRMQQTGLAPPWSPRMERGEPMTFGHYSVEVGPRGLLLDYGRYAGAFDPLRFVRDPIVAVRDGRHELLLGTTHLELPFGRVTTPSYFTLEMDGPVTHRPRLPRPSA